MRATRSALVCGFALAVFACSGSIKPGPGEESLPDGIGMKTPPSGSSAGGANAKSVDGAVGSTSCTFDVGLTPIRRLTQTEYNNTVADLLSDTTHPADQFAPDEKLLGFSAGLSVSPLLAEQYMDAAEALSVTATNDLPTLLGCDPSTKGEDTCAMQFIPSFGRKVYRRALASDEQSGLIALYTASKQYGFRSAIELVMQAMLESPEFLYRVELGTPTKTPEVVQLTGEEIASRLSYFLWQTTPSEDLLEAAEKGELDSSAGIEKYARMMIADPRAHATVKSFHEQWLELDTLASLSKDTTVYPAWDADLEAAMHDETLRFVDDVVFNQAGTVEALLTSTGSFINPKLATLYGVKNFPGTDWRWTALDPTERMGLLTQASNLAVQAKANQSSPIYRGKFVREQILCEPLSPPPAGLVIVPPNPDPNASTRARFAEHSQNPTCASCHTLMDPIGFGFEHYDGIGQWRDMDGKFAVDATGQVNGSRDADGPFDGAIELTKRLAQSQEVRDCVASQWFVYAFGRSFNNELDACSKESVSAAFKASGYKITDLIVAMTSADAFRFRRMDVTAMAGGQP